MTASGDWPGPARGNRRRLLGGAAIVLAGSYLAACSGANKAGKAAARASRAAQATTTAGAAQPGEQPRRGGRYIVSAPPPTSYNVFTDFSQAQFVAGANVYDRLILPRINQPYLLAAAQSIEQPEETRVIVKLRPGQRYQNVRPVNGRAVKAHDIVQNHAYLKQAQAGMAFSWEVEAVAAVSAPDDQTVVFEFTSPRAYLFSAGEFGNDSGQIVPAELLGQLETATPVGSGPYQQMAAIVDAEYRYKRFDGFRAAGDGLPYIDEHVVTILTDTAAQEAAFRGGSLGSLLLTESTLAKNLQRDLGNRITVDRFPGLPFMAFHTNPKRAPWTDTRVRQAVYRILDRQEVLDRVYQGEGSLSWGIIPPALEGPFQLTQAETQQYWLHDPIAGKRLLDAAGFDYGKEYVFITNLGLGDVTTQMAQVIQNQFAAVGVKLQIVPLPLPEWFASVQTKGDFDFDVTPAQPVDTPQTPIRVNSSKAFAPYLGLQDPVIDDLITKSERTLDERARAQLLRQIQFALLDRYANLIDLVSPYSYIAHWNYLRNFAPNKLLSIVPDYLTEMWIAPH